MGSFLRVSWSIDTGGIPVRNSHVGGFYIECNALGLFSFPEPPFLLVTWQGHFKTSSTGDENDFGPSRFCAVI